MQIVRPLGSVLEIQPQLQPALLEIISDDFPILQAIAIMRVHNSASNVIETH
jgi:hypothetical protein